MSDNPVCMPTVFIPHGGGPCFFMDPLPGFPPRLWDNMATYLRGVAGAIGSRPKAVLIISAHWECNRLAVNVAPRSPLLFDYYGFPEHTYQLSYPAPGSPAIAARVREVLAAAGIACDEESQRGLDHGVFIPLMLIYPDADVPVVQLSLHSNLDAATHIAIGRALSPLRNEGVLIIGSGMSYHNLRDFFRDDVKPGRAAEDFDQWLYDTLTDVHSIIRDDRLAAWADAPGARACHPRSEHLIPLMVTAGAAGVDRGRRTYNERLFGKPVSGFQFG